MSIDEKLIAAFRDAEPEIKIQRDTYDKRVIETLNQESNMVQ